MSDRSLLYRALLAVGLVILAVVYLLPSVFSPLPGWLRCLICWTDPCGQLLVGLGSLLF